jgi:hypothetical protein
MADHAAGLRDTTAKCRRMADLAAMQAVARRARGSKPLIRVGFLNKSARAERITALQYAGQMGLFPIGMAPALLKAGTDACLLRSEK